MSAVPEDEVDFGRYWATLVARWWLLLAGLVLGSLVGFLLASSSKQVNRADVTIYLGQPLAAGGGAIQTLGTNPSTLKTTVHSRAAIAEAAKAAGVEPSSFSDGIASAPVAGYLAKLGQTPLISLTVTADLPAEKLQTIATSLAQTALRVVAPFVQEKIAGYKAKIKQDDKELEVVDARINETSRDVRRGDLSPTEKLVLLNLQTIAEQRRTNLIGDQENAKLLLIQAQNVEEGRIVAPATTSKTTARSKRNSVAIGGFIGLLLAAIAALAWGRARLAAD